MAHSEPKPSILFSSRSRVSGSWHSSCSKDTYRVRGLPVTLIRFLQQKFKQHTRLANATPNVARPLLISKCLGRSIYVVACCKLTQDCRARRPVGEARQGKAVHPGDCHPFPGCVCRRTNLDAFEMPDAAFRQDRGEPRTVWRSCVRIHSGLHHGVGEGSFLCGARGHGWSLGGVIFLHSHACWLFVPELLAFESSGSMANEVRWAWLQPEDGAVSTARLAPASRACMSNS